MLSFYDALAFSAQKKNLIAAFLTACLMLFFWILIGFSLENHFQVFSLFKTWLVSSDNSVVTAAALAKIAVTLKNPEFWGLIYQKTLWITFLFFFCGISFFCLALVIAKKTLFNQPKHFTAGFFIITLGKLMLLVSPVIIVCYILLSEILKSVFAYIAGTIIGLNPTYTFPFSDAGTILLAVVIFTYLLFSILLFIERFSFQSLFRIKPILKHKRTVAELVLRMLQSDVLLVLGVVGLTLVGLYANPLYAGFFIFMTYLICILVYGSGRWVLTLPLWVLAGGAFYLTVIFGKPFLSNYLVSFLLLGLLYFCFFFVWFFFWAVLGYLFGSAAYVLRFNRTAAKDIKKKSPEKLKRMDLLYDTYLEEHKNKTQDNYFHHLEEKRQ